MARHNPSRMRRSERPETRNPILSLPSAATLSNLDPATKAGLRALLLDLKADAHARADESWRQHKAPMAAYWKAVAVYAGHTARLLR